MNGDTKQVFDKDGYVIGEVDIATGLFIGIPEHAADSPGGVSGRSLGCPAERSGDGNQGSTAGQATVARRSEAEPGNARPVRTDGPPRDSGTHEAVVGDSESEGT